VWRTGGTVGEEEEEEDAAFNIGVTRRRRLARAAGFVKAYAVGVRRASCSSSRRAGRRAWERGRREVEAGMDDAGKWGERGKRRSRPSR